MHLQGITLLGLSALAVARRSGRNGMKDSNSGVELNEKSRATAYRIDANGAATIECWEIGAFVPKTSSTTSGAISHLAIADQDSLSSVHVNTMAPGTVLRASHGDMAAMFSKEKEFTSALVTVKSGMLEILSHGYGSGSRSDNDDIQDDGSQSHIFADVNGDDWFYFEDVSIQQFKNDDSDIVFKTRSGDVTSTITFLFEEGLQHKKLHDGACSFAGLKTSPGSARNKINDPDATGYFKKQGL